MDKLNIKMLDHYGFQNALNNGVTMEKLCEKYSCTPADVESRIETLYGNNEDLAKKYLKQLAKNDKKAKKRKPKAEDMGEPVEEPKPDEAIKGEVLSEPNEPEQKPEAASDVLAAISKKRKESMQEQKHSIKVQSNLVIKEEAEETETRSAIRAIDERLEARGSRLNKLSDQYDEEYGRFLAEVAERNATIQKLDEIKLKLSDDRAALVEMRQKSGELEAIMVFAYADGRIVIVDEDEELLISDVKGADSVYHDLLEKPECENLRVKDIRVLAKLVALKEISPFLVDLACDDEELGKIFHSLT